MSPVEDGQFDSEGRLIDNSSDPRPITAAELLREGIGHMKTLMFDNSQNPVHFASQWTELAESFLSDPKPFCIVPAEMCKVMAKNIVVHLKALAESYDTPPPDSEVEQLVASIMFETINGGAK